jgi:hypothetical protein
MASFANVSINDGQTTPVAHSFTTGPVVVLPDGAKRYTWLDFSVNGGVVIGANRIDMDVKSPTFVSSQSPKAGDSANQLSVNTRVTVPTLETLSNNTSSGINPQPTHAFDTTVWLKTVRNGRAVAQNVKDALAFARNFSQLTVYTDTVLNYAPPTA